MARNKMRQLYPSLISITADKASLIVEDYYGKQDFVLDERLVISSIPCTHGHNFTIHSRSLRRRKIHPSETIGRCVVCEAITYRACRDKKRSSNPDFKRAVLHKKVMDAAEDARLQKLEDSLFLK